MRAEPRKGNLYVDFEQWRKKPICSEAKQMRKMMNDAKLGAVVGFLLWQ